MSYHNPMFEPVAPPRLPHFPHPSYPPSFSQPTQGPSVPHNFPQQAWDGPPRAMNSNTTEAAKAVSKSIFQLYKGQIIFGMIAAITTCALVAVTIRFVAFDSCTVPTTRTTTISTSATTNTTTTSVALPAQCTSAAVINDSTRNVNYGEGHMCDLQTLASSSAWFRFVGPGGTMIANYDAGGSHCNTDATGYYPGSYPSAVGGNVTGTLYYTYSTYVNNWQNPITVTNCNGYYVYYLAPPPVCDFGVCTM